MASDFYNLFKRDKVLFFEAVRQRVIHTALKSIIGGYDDFVLDVAVFTPSGVVLEEEAEWQLYSYLNSLYPGLIERQKVLRDGSRIDLAMFSYGVEVKLFKKFNKVEVDRAIGQVIGYLDHFERVILVTYTVSESVSKKIIERVEGLPATWPGVSVIVKKVAR